MTVPTLPQTIDESQAMLEEIYTDHNLQYYPSVKDLTLTLIWSLGVISSAERKKQASKLPSLVANTYVWWSGLCSRLNFKTGDILWLKYPAICIYCEAAENCSCEGKKFGSIPKHTIAHYRAKIHLKPETISGWQEMLAKIYGQENARRGFDFAIGRFPEEHTELIECILPLPQDREHLAEELADIGARIFGLANLLKMDLETVFLTYYRGVCTGCRQEKCKCDPRLRQ